MKNRHKQHHNKEKRSTKRTTTTKQRCNSIRGAVIHLNFELILISEHTSKSIYEGSWLASGEAQDMCVNHSHTQMVTWIKR